MEVVEDLGEGKRMRAVDFDQGEAPGDTDRGEAGAAAAWAAGDVDRGGAAVWAPGDMDCGDAALKRGGGGGAGCEEQEADGVLVAFRELNSRRGVLGRLRALEEVAARAGAGGPASRRSSTSCSSSSVIDAIEGE